MLETDEIIARIRFRTLPIPVKPRCAEGLEEFLLRATAENWYVRTSLLRGLLPQPLEHEDRGDAKAKLIAGLADLFGAPAQRLKILLEEMGYGPRIRFSGTTINRALIGRHRRVSPRALAADPYLRSIWRVLPIGFDPISRERLLTHCPQCRKRLGFVITYGVCFCEHCAARAPQSPSCWTDLRAYSNELIMVQDDEALDLATSLLDPDLVGRRDFPFRLHDQLMRKERGEIFELIVSIGTILTIYGPMSGIELPKPEFNRSIEPLSPHVMAEAARIVLNWPSGMHDLSDHISVCRPRRRAHPLKMLWRVLPVYSSLRTELSTIIVAEKSRTARMRWSVGVGAPSEVEFGSDYETAALKEEWNKGWRRLGLPFSAFRRIAVLVSTQN
jgi:hypothetical protein